MLTDFSEQGFTVISDLLSPMELEQARGLSDTLIAQHRDKNPSLVSNSVSIADVTKQHPGRNPEVQADKWVHEPFIISDLMALEPHFSVILSKPELWQQVASLLDCSLNEVVFHFSNITRKPAGVGPAIGWHRDGDNTYFASADERTLRVLLPLQPMSAVNGGTAVLPGSHRATERPSQDTSTTLCPSISPGSALIIHSNIWHGGAENRSQYERDVLIVQFGVRSSALRHQAQEQLSLGGLNEFMAFSEIYR